MLFGLVEPPSRCKHALALLKRSALAICVALLTLLGAPAAGALANTFFVSNGNDSGGGSLRAAIIGANAHPGADTITVPAGVPAPTVDPQTPLPAIKGVVLLDGKGLLTVNDSLTKGNALVLAGGSGGSTVTGITVLGATGAGILVTSAGNLIEGITAGSTVSAGGGNHNGLVIQSGNNTIGGTVATAADTFTKNSNDGVVIQSPTGGSASGNVVEGNFIGTDGAHDRNVGNGVAGLVLMKGASNNTIGGSAGGTPNVISGNAAEGVLLAGTGTNDNLVEGNFIGDTSSHGPVIPNKNGVVVKGGAGNNTLTLNQISGNNGTAVTISGTGTSGNLVQGNVIGPDTNGNLVGNGGHGVLISGGATMNTIGGTVAGDGNTIAVNLQAGVELSGSSTTGDPVLRNKIFLNGPNATGPGIALVNGADGNEPAPTITSVMTAPTATTISGTGSPGTRIEAFANSNCGDPEGAEFLNATTTDGNGAWTMSVAPLASGTGVTATQTDMTKMNTSMFSSCVSAP